MYYVYIGCIGLIIFIVSLLAGKKRKVITDYLLICWILILGLNVAAFLILNLHHNQYPQNLYERMVIEFTDASVFLHGPVFLFYTLGLTQVGFKFQRKYLLHLIPFLVSLLLLAHDALVGAGESYEIRMALSILKMVSLFIYIIWVIRQLKRHRSLIQHIYSNTEEKNLDWLVFLSWGILIIWIISSICIVINLLTSLSLYSIIIFLPNLSICLFIYLIGYFGVHQNSIFVHIDSEGYPNENIEIEVGDSLVERKYKKSGLSDEKADQLFNALSDYMETDQPFLNLELSLFDLAKQLKVLPNHLSQVINVKTNRNFFDYINIYRVNAVKGKILNGKLREHNLLGLAIDSGFNSKASFNRAFKKHTGLTPSDFKNTHIKRL